MKKAESHSDPGQQFSRQGGLRPRGGAVPTEVIMGFAIVGLLLVAIIVIGSNRPESSESVGDPATSTGSSIPDSTLSLFGEMGAAVNTSQVSVSADGRTVLGSDQTNGVRTWNAETGAESTLLEKATSKISGLDIAPDGNSVLLGYTNGTAEILDRASQSKVATFGNHDSPVTEARCYPFGGMALSAERNGDVCLWSARDGTLIDTFEVGKQVSSLQFAADGTRFIAGATDGTVQIWDTRDTSGPKSRFRNHRDTVAGVAFTPNAEHAFSADVKGMVVKYDLASSAASQELAAGEPIAGPVTAMSLSPGGTRMVLTTASGQLHVVNLYPAATQTASADLGAPANDVVFSVDGQFVYCACEGRKIQVWQLPQMSPSELTSIQSRMTMMQQRSEGLKTFAGHMELADAAVRKEQVEQARTEYTAARGAAPRDSLEYHLADKALEEIETAVASGDRYRTLMEQGKDAADAGDYRKARSRFEEAREVMPQRPEAPQAIAKLDEAAALQDMSRDVEIERKLAFEFDAGGQDLLEIGSDYAWIYDRKEIKKQTEKQRSRLFLFSRVDTPETPVGQKTSPIGWTAQITAKKPLPSDNLKARLKLVRLSDTLTVSEEDYPLKRGERVFQVSDSIPAPEGGWTAGDYSFRKYIVQPETDPDTGETIERVSEHGTPLNFQIGLIRWEKKSSSISPQDVQQAGDFIIENDQTVRSGDGFRVDARGKVTPAVPSLYRDLLGAARPIPNDIGGIASNSRKRSEYEFVLNRENFAALLCRYDARDISNWTAFRKTQNHGVALSTGKVQFSINSVVKKASGSRMVAIRPGNTSYWKDDGKFEITVHRGVWDFVDPLNLSAKTALLKSFWK